jgi:acyl phosphate:glycerol-3-phosphate acyltransferase
MTPLLLTAVFSYLLGSIPFGYLLVRAFRGEDVRRTGSGNIGATNVSRTSPALGLVTLLLDALKGSTAVLLTHLLFPFSHTLPAYAALFAVLGHIFPIWLKFRGGKGVATATGSFLLLAPKAVLAIIGIFIAVVLLFRYISLGSIVAVILFPLLLWMFHSVPGAPVLIATIASVLILAKHSQNIRRLIAGTEPRFPLRRG